MIRIIVYISIYLESILVWFLLRSELGNFISIGQVLIVSVASSVMLIKGVSRVFWGIMAASSWGVMFAMVMAMIMVRQEADSFAHAFLEQNRCRPGFDSMKATNSGWRPYGSYLLVRNIERYGATREIRYFDTGLFRYGFLYDEKRSIVLPECAAR